MNPKRRAKVLFLRWAILFFLSLRVFSGEGVSSENKSFLWEVGSETGSVYILGSIHAARKDLYPLNSKIETAFYRSDALVVEVNVNNIDQNMMQNMILEGSIYTGDETLEDHISKETYTLAKSKLEEFSLPINQFIKLKPSFLALTLTSLELLKLGYEPHYGIDAHFLRKAKKEKPILELETFDYQVKLFNSFSEHEQELFLLYTLLDLDIMETELHRIIESWRQGDVITFEALISKSIKDRPQLYPVFQKLIYERNKNMVITIENYLSSGKKYFIVVGAAHLVGEKGIIAILREKGYLVKQL